MKEDRSCWECLYNKIGGNTFLGRCNMRNLKDIPPHVVDKGCPRWKSKWKLKNIKQLSFNV